MPESIITAAAASVPEGTTVLIPTAVKWLWGIFTGACLTFSGAVGWLFNRQEKTDNKVNLLETRHDQDIRKFMAACGERHERDYSRATDFATKDDIRTIHDKFDVLTENVQDIQNNMQSINNNVVNLSLAIKK